MKIRLRGEMSIHPFELVHPASITTLQQAPDLTLTKRDTTVPRLDCCQRSSVVEQQFRKLQVVGSIPTVGSTVS